MMNPNILNRTPLMFFDRAVNAQRSQLLTVMAVRHSLTASAMTVSSWLRWAFTALSKNISGF